jgi:gliding motility-associated lipoprotein GldD
LEDPPETILHILGILLVSGANSVALVFGLVALVLLLACSALISGAEVAFFSLSRSEIDELETSDSGYKLVALELLKRPKRLLATILIANNFVNVGIVILSTYLIGANIPHQYLEFRLLDLIPVGRVIEVFGITLIVLLFGEIIPKIYANQHARNFAGFMAYPLHYLSHLFSFLSIPLIKLTGLIDSFGQGQSNNISMDELSHALELTQNESSREKEDRKILEGIVKFGHTSVKQIMKPRPDMEAMEVSTNYSELLEGLLECGFSRVPIYQDSLDRIVGIIHVKDLLQHIDEPDDFNWQALMRAPFFVPESKMIDDLLEEFKGKKVHMAIVVDEYGGCEGLVTLEDIIEEIVGDISDEFDDDEVVYSKLDDNNYVFEGKTNLKQFYRVFKIEGEEFEEQKGEADTLAGFILEIAGRIPVKNQKVPFSNFEFTIESADKRRIKRVKVSRRTEPVETPDRSNGVLLAMAVLVVFGLGSCNSDHTPKPKGFMRIDLPTKSYQAVETDCPFSFETAVYSNFVVDMKNAAEPCWFNIEYPQFKAKLHCSYKHVDGNLKEFLEESRTLTNKHISKATNIEENLILRPEARVFGTLYLVDGNEAASPLQFHITDSTEHFLRAALYFNVPPSNDSLAPVIDFLEEDVMRMIETFKWRS